MDAATMATDRRPIGFWLKLVDRLIDDGFDGLLGHAGLARRHWQVLTMLQHGPATVQRLDTSLAPFLGDRATVQPVLEELSARGWATRTGDQVALTRAGAVAQAELLAMVSEHRQRVTAGIAAEEYLATVDILRRMAGNLGWVDVTDEPAR
jgi:DNA-binding MarR family transcriptional regulator